MPGDTQNNQIKEAESREQLKKNLFMDSGLVLSSIVGLYATFLYSPGLGSNDTFRDAFDNFFYKLSVFAFVTSVPSVVVGGGVGYLANGLHNKAMGALQNFGIFSDPSANKKVLNEEQLERLQQARELFPAGF